jgi:ATP-dependent RNA helicase RhlE
MSFESLLLIDELLRAVRAESYTAPTPIQTQAIPSVLEGRDLLGCAQTGTGKTAAFTLPTLQRLFTKGAPAPAPAPAAAPARSAHGAPARSAPRTPVRALVLTPTRELAAQIGETFRSLGRFLPLRSTVIFGGVGYEPQDRALRAGVEVLVATPGRLLDHLSRGTLSLAQVEVLILDEADQMLDMGFIHDVRKIVARVPKDRQTLFFSATMPTAIRALADEWLRNPVEVSVAPPSTTVERVKQGLFFVETPDKRGLLEDLLSKSEVTRALVFSRTKHGANKIAKWLDSAGIRAEPIHGNKSQNARERALASFKKGTTLVLVATDLAARGLDIDEVSHVLNYDLPNVPEVYVHRIGRTARAGAEGVAWSFCNEEEREYLRDIERVTRQKIPVVAEHAFRSPLPPPVPREDRGGAPVRSGGGAPAHRSGGGAPRSNNGGGNRSHGNGGHHGAGASSANRGGDNRGPRSGGGAPRANDGRSGDNRGARPAHNDDRRPAPSHGDRRPAPSHAPRPSEGTVRAAPARDGGPSAPRKDAAPSRDPRAPARDGGGARDNAPRREPSAR